MLKKEILDRLMIAAGQKSKEKEYWLKTLSNLPDAVENRVPFDQKQEIDVHENGPEGTARESVSFSLPSALTRRLINLSGGSDHTLHMILVAAIEALIHCYTGSMDMILCTPIYKQERETELINTLLVLRNILNPEMTFKQHLISVRRVIIEATENYSYPVEILLEELHESDRLSVLNMAILLENIHDKGYIRHINPLIIFSFNRRDEQIQGKLEYLPFQYKESTIERVIAHFECVLKDVLLNVEIPLDNINIIPEEERSRLLYEFNDTRSDYPAGKTIPLLFEVQAEMNPDHTAVMGEIGEKRHSTRNRALYVLSYKKLNENANHLALRLREKIPSPDTIIALMGNGTIEVIIGILGILKTGGAYLPLDREYPPERVQYMLEDSKAEILVTTRSLIKEIPFRKETILLDEHIESSTGSKNELSDSGFRSSEKKLQSGNLAYVIYTSGTTGKPKGTLTTHFNVIRVVKDTNYISITERDRILQLSNYAFDGSVFNIYGALLNSSALVMIRQEEILALEQLAAIIKTEQITVFFVTTALFNTLVDLKLDSLANIRKVLLGGETASVAHTKKALYFLGEGRILNGYGPTETTVFATSYSIDHIPEDAETIPIGKPLANTSVYILNKGLQPVPVGVNGEIYIGGDGVARGYLNNPELTAEKISRAIISSSSYTLKSSKTESGENEQNILTVTSSTPLFSKDQCQNISTAWDRVYYTGDLAKWLADGNIKFIGRIDHQVKIRGFRIEPGEIEFRILQFDKINKAIVLVREENGSKYLCAYLLSEEKINIQVLRHFLANKLPDYMIPSHFVQVDEMPLNANGKIDRKKLPPPGLETKDHYIPPGTPMEEILADAWQDILGRKKISINDTFFSIGGDSIKAIQLAARLTREGYKVDIRDILRNLSIAELAPLAKKVEIIADQSVITGSVPLTPIQKTFFRFQGTDFHHFNQAVILSLKDNFETKALQFIFTKIQEHHDALRMTFKIENDQVIQTNNGLNIPLSLEIIDLRGTKSKDDRFAEKVNEIQSSINLETGPLMKLGLFHLEEGDRLLIVIHHLVIDGISWRILFEDIDTLYHQYINKQPAKLPFKANSFKTWAWRLNEYAGNAVFLTAEKDYWEKIKTHSQRFPKIPKDFETNDNCVRNTRELSFRLDEEQTENLLTKVNEPFNTEINDILMTALGLGIIKTWGHRDILIALEGHGREKIIEDLDISRTVGWFTTIYPVILKMSYENDLSRQIKEVKEHLHQLPRKGIGYGILQYLTPEPKTAEMEFEPEPQISFNYLGQFTTDVEKNSYTLADDPTGNSTSPNAQNFYELTINCFIAKKQLQVSVLYNKNQYKADTIEALLNHFKNQLNHIITYCCTHKKKELSPSDLTYKNLSIDELDQLQQEHEEGIEDIYPLSAMQEGILFHYLYDKTFFAYFEQISYRMQGQLDISFVEKSLNELLKRHDILRTVFIQKQGQRLLQAVYKSRKMDFLYEDISKRDDKNNYLAKFKEQDKERYFELYKDISIRVSVFKTATAEYEFIWSFHHILLDGWCIGILFSEFLEIFQASLENRAPSLPEVKHYKEYIKWLEKQNKNVTRDYWKNYLDGYETVAEIPGQMFQEKTVEGYNPEQVIFNLEEEMTGRLKDFAARNKVTLNIVIQVLWGILLGRYNCQEDVVFGTVVAGRPPDIEGVENMVGLFINSIPVRIRWEEPTSLIELLQRIHMEMIEAEPHHYYPLPEIQANTRLKKDLLTHVLAFENYPVGEELSRIMENRTGDSNSFRISAIDVFEQSNYNFNIIIIPGKQLTVKFNFNSNVYKSNFIRTISNQLERLILQVLNPHQTDIKIKEINLLSEDELTQLLNEFNGPVVEYTRDKAIKELFEEQVETTPDNVAVAGKKSGTMSSSRIRVNHFNAQIHLTHTLTYRELNKKSNQLAWALRNEGVKTNTFIGLLIENSIDMIMGMLAIIKAGGCYLPVDPDYPEKRIQFMLKDSSVSMLICGRSEGTDKIPVNILETGDITVEKYSEINPETITGINDLLYIIYTSGSAGVPKGVLVKQRGIVNLVKVHREVFKEDSYSRMSQVANPGFDAMAFEVWPCLLNSAALYIADRDICMDPARMIKWLIRDGINISFQPTAMVELLMKEEWPLEKMCLTALRSAGDKLRNNLTQKYPFKVYNLYGPTEDTIWTTWQEVTIKQPNEPAPSIGRPVPNHRVYIMDIRLNLQSPGVAGELCIGGDGLAVGYLNRVELTDTKFIRHDRLSSQRLFRTGDSARWLPDGNLEFLGRIDTQVKIRGYRIELGEIETQLLMYAEINEAVVLTKMGSKNTGTGEENKNQYIYTYFTSDKKIPASQLKMFLSKSLPHFMIPSYFIQIEKMPLTPNGKVDRKSLHSFDIEVTSDAEYLAPKSKTEKAIAQIWQEVLNLEKIGIHDNFFDIGGHSLSIIQVNTRLKDLFNKDISVAIMFRYTTINSLAEYLDSEDTGKLSNDSKENINETISMMKEATDVLFADEID